MIKITLAGETSDLILITGLKSIYSVCFLFKYRTCKNNLNISVDEVAYRVMIT